LFETTGDVPVTPVIEKAVNLTAFSYLDRL